MKALYSLLTALFIFITTGVAQSPVKTLSTTQQGWMATMIISDARSVVVHYILMADGTVQSFRPGGVLEPVGIDNVAGIAGGLFHVVAVKKDGTVWTWGRNDDQQLGNQALTAAKKSESQTPVQVSGITNAIQVSAAAKTSFALLADGTIKAWGVGNCGMTGDGKELTGEMTTARISGRPIPVAVKGITNAIAISGAMALLADGTVMTWGNGKHGRLGNGTTENVAAPVPVSNIKNAIAIAGYEDGGMALLADGSVWVWGKNYKGQLANGTRGNNQHEFSAVPLKVPGINNAIAITAGTTCFALLKGDSIKAWGWGEVGAMGAKRPDVNSTPLPVPIITNATAIKSANGSGFALLPDGTVMGWGANTQATGLYKHSYSPIKVASIK
ncbi:hypothetical protein HB364_08880 [Pseudoflavitalea sp. X16]|uniref:RCC1 domain-containing protein n=1 Tax=Paraflavitalea devenefica TaxID=2716334 RepID=UPI001421A04F|nr:hypothetical protein [Paraflavitalea devenefica]NII25192.1 hypothetical protein [Paraflavitalea devenefica]